MRALGLRRAFEPLKFSAAHSLVSRCLLSSPPPRAKKGPGPIPAVAFVKRLYEGTVLEAMARGVPAEDRAFLAHRWGFFEVDAGHVAGTKAEKLQQEDSHPIFGQMVRDLGYKKVYATSLKRLVRAPVWERQRILRPERAMQIASSLTNDQKKYGHQQASMPGVITFYKDKSREEITGIVDGQHRVGALMILSEQGAWDANQSNIMIDVFDTDGDAHVAELFRDINLAEPVRLVDMPEAAREQSMQTRAALGEAVDMLKEKYSVMFKPSSRCRAPHVNSDVMRDDIFQNEIMQRHNLASGSQLLAWLCAANEKLSKLGDAHWEKKCKGKRGAAALAKAKENKFYLGLDKSWFEC